MSGYQDDRSRQSSRDSRERSPTGSRRDDRSYRDDRNRYGTHNDHRGPQYGQRDQGRGQSRGRGPPLYSGSNTRGTYSNRGSTSYTSSSSEKLPDLPTEVLIPSTGGKLKLSMPIPQGGLGQSVNLLVNHFALQSLPTIKIYQFDIRMTVPASSQRRGSEKVSAMQQAKVLIEAKQLFGPHFVFDGVSLGWTTDALCPIEETLDAVIDLPGHSNERHNQVHLSIRNSGTVNIRALVNWLQSGDAGLMSHADSNVEDALKFLNATFRQDPASRWITRPKTSSFFNRSPSLTLALASTGGVLEAIRGIHQAVQVTFGHLSLNVDTVCSAFYVPGVNMVDLARALIGVSPRQNLADPGMSSTVMQASDRMIGMFVNVRHLNESRNSNKMRIQKLNSQGARGLTFQALNRETGQSLTTSVYDYFQRRYNTTLQYPDLPLLVTKDGAFPMELCFSAAGERYKEALQGAETADFIKWATSPAYVRNSQIMDNVKRLHWHELETPKKMGLSVSTTMLQVKGRILPCPIPIYRSGTDTRGPESGSWNLRNKILLSAMTFKSWGVLYLPGGRGVDDRTLQEFTRALANSCLNLGLVTPDGPPTFLKGNPQGNIKEEIRNLYAKTGNTFGQKPQILFFLLHQGANPSLYRTIKAVCEVDIGCPSQVMLIEKALKSSGQLQYLGNIGLKVNLKLGGANSMINIPFIKRSRVMMLGGDSSHPSPGELRRIPPPPSYCALVASYDTECSKYSAVSTTQDATTELIASFTPMMKELLKRWQEKNQGLTPSSIIYWRDGIAESQVPAFMDTEVKALQDVCQESQQKMKITVVNCVKRHHTRFFPGPGERGDKLGNCMPGSIVEASRKQDIFLVSQSALQGTVRPCHYTILLDENNLSPDDFQSMTNGLCFGYGRATRSVSIVPPVFYADQVCERSKMHLSTGGPDNDEIFHNDIHDDLIYTMYWQ